MRHAERFVKHIRPRPCLPSECRSDDVVNHRAVARSPTLFAVWYPLSSLFAVRIPNRRVWKIFTIYSIIRMLHDFDKLAGFYCTILFFIHYAHTQLMSILKDKRISPHISRFALWHLWHNPILLAAFYF